MVVLRSLLVGAALALLLTASPTQAEVSIRAIDDLGIIGLEQPANVTVVVEVGCVDPAFADADQIAQLNVALAAPEGVAWSGKVQYDVAAPTCTAPTLTTVISAPFEVVVTRSAPGLTPLQINATATLLAGPGGGGSTATTAFSVTGEASFLLAALPTPKLLVPKGGQSNTTVRLENFGNVAVSVAIEQTAGAAELQAVEPVLLDAVGQPGATKEVVLHFRSARVANATLAFHPSAQGDPSLRGAPLALELELRGREGVLQRVPGPPLLPLALLAFGVGAALRRRA